MRAAVVTPAGVVVRDEPLPEPGLEQVRVRVRAIGLNRADLGVAAGQMHGAIGGPGTLVGTEFAGEVDAVGEGVTLFRPGDRVMGTGAGAYAEYVLANHRRISWLPDASMAWETAASLPVGLQTMHNAIATAGRLRAGESVLIQGASSGVGLLGMQIAKVLGAGLVLGSSTDPGRRARLAEFGADIAVDTTAAGWPEVVRAATGGGVDLIIDQVSGAMVNANLQAAALRGRIVNVGRLGGTRGEFDFDLHALKRIDYIGVTFRTRTNEEVRVIVSAMRAVLWGAVRDGRIRMPIDRVFPLDDVAAALAHMRANAHFGKIVMVP